MSILDSIFTIFNAEVNRKISERMMIVDVNFNIKYSNIPSYQECINIVNMFPTRDKVEIELKNSFEDYIDISNLEEFHEEKLISFINDSDEDEDVKVKIRIRKSVVNNTISIYRFESFCKEIIKPNILDTIGIFSEVLREHQNLIFEMFDCSSPFSTESMQFRAASNITTTIEFNRINRLEECKSNSYFLNVNEYELLPEDFHMTTSFQSNPFQILFEKIETIFSMAYIANTASIDRGTLSIQICGQKNINNSYELYPNLKVNSNKEFYKIYKWIYTDGNSTDKAIIARNIISLHCKYVDLIRLDEKTFASICSSYSLYQKDNVEKYLELKNKLSEYVLNLYTQISGSITNLIQKLKNNILAFLTFMISVIFANMASSLELNNIFTAQVTFIINWILIGSIGYMAISIYEVNLTIANLKECYEKLKISYRGLLDDQDINEIFSDSQFKEECIKKIQKKRNIICLVWGAIIIILGISINVVSYKNNTNANSIIESSTTTSSGIHIK